LSFQLLKDRLEAVQQEKTNLQAAITASQSDFERVKRDFIRENGARLLRVLSQLCLQQGITDAAIPTDGDQLREFKVLHDSKQKFSKICFPKMKPQAQLEVAL
jgi:hypothetical protein